MNNPSRRYFAQLLARADLIPARDAFASAAKCSRKWDEIVSESIAVHGTRPQGGHVSGIYSEHFPELTQRLLRDLANRVTAENERAYSLRPRRVQMSTMRNLRLAVHSRDGSGYYG